MYILPKPPEGEGVREVGRWEGGREGRRMNICLSHPRGAQAVCGDVVS